MGVVLREGPLTTPFVDGVLQVRARKIVERAVQTEVARVDVVATEKGLGRLSGLFRAQDSPREQEMVILRDS